MTVRWLGVESLKHSQPGFLNDFFSDCVLRNIDHGKAKHGSTIPINQKNKSILVAITEHLYQMQRVLACCRDILDLENI